MSDGTSFYTSGFA